MTERNMKVKFNITYEKANKLYTIKGTKSTIWALENCHNAKIVKLTLA